MQTDVIKDFDSLFKGTTLEETTQDGKLITLHTRVQRIGELDLGRTTTLDMLGVILPSEGVLLQYCPIDVLLAKDDFFLPFSANGEVPAFVRVICSPKDPVRWSFAKGIYETNPDFDVHEVRVDGGRLQIAHVEFQSVARNEGMTAIDRGQYWTKSKAGDFEAFDIDTAFGDGIYKLYAGYDKNGTVCQLVCDFIDIGKGTEEKRDFDQKT